MYETLFDPHSKRRDTFDPAHFKTTETCSYHLLCFRNVMNSLWDTWALCLICFMNYSCTWIIPMVTWSRSWSIDQRGKVILDLPSATYSTWIKGLLHSEFYGCTTVNNGLRRHLPGCHFLCSGCVSRSHVRYCTRWNAQVRGVREIWSALAANLCPWSIRYIESAVQDAFRGSLLCSTWLLWKHAKLWALQGK